MDQEKAEIIVRAARELGAWNAHSYGGRVHVELCGQDSAYHELGGLRMELCRNRTAIQEYWQADSDAGVMWSRQAAATLGQLDALRERLC